jgi:hypothetical protein
MSRLENFEHTFQEASGAAVISAETVTYVSKVDTFPQVWTSWTEISGHLGPPGSSSLGPLQVEKIHGTLLLRLLLKARTSLRDAERLNG